MSYKFAYLLASLAFLLVWLALFLKAKNLRKEMLVLSVIAAVVGPISEFWYLKDYWHPYFLFRFPIGGFEDLIFGFAIGGIGAIAYETFFVNGICLCERKKLKKEWLLLIFILIETTSLVVLTNWLGVNSIFSSSAGMVIATLIMLTLRPDLLPNAFFSGILVALVMFSIYFVGSFVIPWHEFLKEAWSLHGTKFGYLILGRIPATEMLWGLSWGMIAGPLYEFLIGARTFSLRRQGG